MSGWVFGRRTPRDGPHPPASPGGGAPPPPADAPRKRARKPGGGVCERIKFSEFPPNVFQGEPPITVVLFSFFPRVCIVDIHSFGTSPHFSIMEPKVCCCTNATCGSRD